MDKESLLRTEQIMEQLEAIKKVLENEITENVIPIDTDIIDNLLADTMPDKTYPVDDKSKVNSFDDTRNKDTVMNSFDDQVVPEISEHDIISNHLPLDISLNTEMETPMSEKNINKKYKFNT